MSIVCVQFGQCGNQIGNCLYEKIYDDLKLKENIGSYCKNSINKWFHVNKRGKWEPRSVLVDTELKTVEVLSKLPFQFKNVASRNLGGSANNWAHGYMVNGRTLKSQILDAVRSEIEKCDYLTSILNILSSSGGTGSGLGSYIIECLRNEYPTKNITNTIILPYMKGEIVTQSYNSILSLSHLYALANHTILFQNERMHYLCNYSLDIKDVGLEHINCLISHQLASLFQPIKDVSTCDVLNDLTSHPKYKYLQVKTEPNFRKNYLMYEGDREWKPFINALSKQSRFEYNQQEQFKIQMKTKFVASALISRGPETINESLLASLNDKKMYVSWVPQRERFKNYHELKGFLSLDKSLTHVINNNNIYVPLNCIVEDAWRLFTNNVYVHHYKKHGIDEAFFLNAFQTMENILNDYKNL
ncbi:tubulin delta chain-like [Aethina tumida]|uniref:tubulin delta chain-like n=1 Tax=Aethina tumida TaxID=116153 RepID=UPI00214747A8|nr:tubulin delta chain-like [Aethina tumida]